MSLRLRSTAVLLLAFLTALGLLAPASALAYIENGGDNPVVAAPPVTTPATARCTTTLASHFPSNGPDGAAQNYSGTLAPPAACPGPWAKVVLTQTTSVSGRQYDRSGTLVIGGVTVWFGTTQEPSGATPTTWTFSKDITRYSALLRQPQPYTGGIVNYTSDVYTGVYDQTVTITYYRADAHHPAAVVPDAVVGVPVPDLNPGVPSATVPVSGLPRNIVGADLELTLKGNGCDEQWFTAVPDEVAARFPGDGLCAAGAYREARVAVDGTPAGAVGTFPHIYSGGIVPTLWRPVVAIDTFDLRPENLDLTPFAGRLVDGGPHQFAFAITPLNDNWNVAATLFLYTDHHAAQTSGALTTDDVMAAPTTHTASSAITGGARYDETARRTDVTAGYVNTSAGRVSTRVTYDRSFDNGGEVTDGGLTQQVQQTDRVLQSSTATLNGRTVRRDSLVESYPIAITFDASSYVDDQNFALSGTVNMTQNVLSTTWVGGRPVLRAWRWNVDTAGTLARTDGVTSESDGHGSTYYVGTDDLGRPYYRRVTADHGRVTSDTQR